jgi:hypothetical protein
VDFILREDDVAPGRTGEAHHQRRLLAFRQPAREMEYAAIAFRDDGDAGLAVQRRIHGKRIRGERHGIQAIRQALEADILDTRQDAGREVRRQAHVIRERSE